ncbi:MAG: DUF1587 domain-containing protein, partial [Planctomycetaceae bacterium]
MRVVRRSICVVVSLVAVVTAVRAAEPKPDHFAGLAESFRRQARPLLNRFCLRCHSQKEKKGDLDLEQFKTLAAVRRGIPAWLKVAEMLDNGEMPPSDSSQPSVAQRKQLREWVRRYLVAESLANAGDPGPVVLRRLNNAEYTYTIRDLTRVALDPVREFPADNAAGEGFTNTGDALVMSPALSQKYFSAAKETARHVVLLPDGFRFSPHVTRRGWTDEILAEIRKFYAQFADSVDLGTGLAVGYINGHSDTRLGKAGRLPLEKYFAALLAERDALTRGSKTIGA